MTVQLLFAGLVLAADQVTKALVASRLAVGQSEPVGSWLRIRHVQTRFECRGLIHSRFVLLLIWSMAVAGLIFATRFGDFFHRSEAQMGLAGAVAGAASNLYDRFRRSTVIDFLDLGWWPAFNLADVAILLGSMTAIWFI